MKKIDAHAHVFDHIGSMGKAGELRPLGNGNCRWATGEEFRIIPEGKGDKEYLVETFMDVMDENDVEKAILLQGVLYGLQNEYAMNAPRSTLTASKPRSCSTPSAAAPSRSSSTSSTICTPTSSSSRSLWAAAFPATTAISRSTAPR